MGSVASAEADSRRWAARLAMALAGAPVVVTGARGGIGSALCAILAEAGCRLRPASRHQAGPWQGDLADAAFCRQLVADSPVVIHLAAQTSARAAMAAPIADMAANLGLTLNLLDACAAAGHRPVFLLAGTATQVGVTGSPTPRRADGCDRPATLYDVHKLAAEQALGVYGDAGHVRGLTLRLANVYGSAGGGKDRNILSRVLDQALAGADLTVIGTGTERRDYVHVCDVVRAFVQAALAPLPSRERAVVIGSGTGHTLEAAFGRIADLVAEATGRRVAVHRRPPGPDLLAIETRQFVADVRMARALLAWRPAVDLAGGLAAMVAARISRLDDGTRRGDTR